MSVVIIVNDLNINEVLKTLCLEALNRSFNIGHAANILGVSARTVHNHMKRFNIKYCYDQKKYIIKN